MENTPSRRRWPWMLVALLLLAGGFIYAQMKKPKPPNFGADWKTNWEKHAVDLGEIQSGGVGRDGIPPVYDPKFAPVADVEWLAPTDPVAVLVMGEAAKAYPLEILMFHEMANDTLAGQPVLMTYCPLCNAVIAFDRRIDGKPHTFGVSGLLRNSDLVMWDHETESLWQQFTGEAIVGDHTGTTLKMLPSALVSFAEFAKAHPDGLVLTRETGARRRYGANPYRGYDSSDKPFLFRGKMDTRLHPTARVIAIDHGKGVAFRHDALAQSHVIHSKLGDKAIVLFHRPGANSAMDRGIIREGRDVGSTAVYESGTRTFRWQDEAFVDAETGSTWNIFGECTAGELKGKSLTPVLHFNHFWFAWAAFYPFTEIRPEP